VVPKPVDFLRYCLFFCDTVYRLNAERMFYLSLIVDFHFVIVIYEIVLQRNTAILECCSWDVFGSLANTNC